MAAPSRYVHGTAPEEQSRLSAMNALLNDAAVAELRLAGGERILDVGSGLGQLSRAMARAAGPAAKAVGIERSEEQRAEAIRQARDAGEPDLVEFRGGDALALPLSAGEWGSFDVVHARFVLEHVGDPLAVVREMVRAARPGGRIVLQDDDHDLLRLWPEPPGLSALWAAYIRTYDRLGNDPFVGRRLVSLLHQAGARPARCTWLFFGASAGQPTFRGYVDNLVTILTGARSAILETAHLDEATFEDGVDALRSWVDRPDAAFWYGIAWAEATRPD